MVLKRNPEIIPEEFVEFDEIFGDINSPGIFLADNEDKFIPKAIILDGHSTLLVYSGDAKDVSWEAYRDQASFVYTADKLGDGAILFPHNFYFEFDIELSEKIISVAGNFIGSGINAIVMPMNNITPDKFVHTLQQRLSTSFSTVLKQIEQSLTINVGSVLKIPDQAITDISFKLALLGISVDRINVLSEKALPKGKVDIVEKIFDGPPHSSMVEQLKLEEEEKRNKSKEKVKTSAKRDEAKQDLSEKTTPIPKASPSPLPPPPMKRSTGGMPIPKAPSSMAPPPSAGPPGPGSPPSAPSTPGGLPKPKPSKSDTIPSTMPAPSRSAMPAPPSSRGSMPAPPKQGSTPKIEQSRKKSKKSVSSILAAEEEEELALLPKELMGDDYMDDVLETPVMKKETKRFTNVSWFERMIPNRAYPLKIKLSSRELMSSASITSVMSGEKASEKAGSFVTKSTSPIIIRPIIPGSIVVPTQQEVAFDEEGEVEFYVTPIAIGKLNANIQFIQDGSVFHKIPLDMKVITHRISKLVSYIGILTSAIPMLFAFFLNQPIDVFMNERIKTYLPAVIGVGYLIPFLASAVFFGGGGLFYVLRKPKSKHTSLSFPR